MNYCGKCGRKLDTKTGLCPKCDKKKVQSTATTKRSLEEIMRRYEKSQGNINTYQNQTNNVETDTAEDNISSSMKKKRFHPITVIISLVLCITVIAGVVLSVLGIFKLPFFVDNDRIRKISENMYITTPSENNIRYDNESGIPYIDNEVLITFKNEVNRTSVDEMVDSINGKIIGVIETTNTYQVQINVWEDYSKLTSAIAEIEKNDIIEHAGPNLLLIYNTEYCPNSDVHWQNDWSDIPNGNNWGIEAIKAPAAWEYLHDMQDVNVGILDNQFLDHNDLHFEKTFLNTASKTIDGYEHGTHVAGTIGAGFDNRTGISGVCPKAKLYGYSYNGSDTAMRKVMPDGTEVKISDLALVELAIANLLSNKCKVINFSVGTGDEICYAASKGNLLNSSIAQAYLLECANEMEHYLTSLLMDGADFTFVVAAGNTNGYAFQKTDSVKEQDYPYFGYKQVKNGGESGGALAKYSFFLNTIEKEEIKNRIIVVGSIDNKSSDSNESFSLSNYSNIGSRVDVVAPGNQIESTVDNNDYGIKNGTSMAAPHVSGIAAMLYSVNPNLKGDEVKRIICETATREVDGYKLVDAEAAVKKALNGSISGSVISSKDNSELKDVTVTVYQTMNSENKEVGNTSTSSSGVFKLDLPAGTYDLEFNKDGYKPHTLGIKIDKGVMTILKDDIVLEPDIRIDVNNCISDAVNESYSVDHYSATCRLPKFLIDTDEIAAVNSEILNKYNSYLQKNESAQQTNRYDFLYDIDYTYVISDNVLSLMIKNRYVPSNGYSEYSVYNIDISSASLLSRDEMMERFGIDWDLVKSSIRNQKNSSYGMKIDEANISDDNLSNTQFYIGEDKKLYAIYRWKSGPGIGGEDGYRYDVFKIDG